MHPLEGIFDPRASGESMDDAFFAMRPGLSEFFVLQKAMEMGAPLPSYTGGGSGAPIVPQSIESTLEVVTERAEHATFWKDFPKDPNKIGSVIHEYTVQDSLGDDLEIAQAEGELGPELDSSFERLYAKCAFMSHVRTLTDVMSMMTTVGTPDALTKLNQDGATKQSLLLDKMLLHGRADCNPEGFNGIFKTVEDYDSGSHVIDMEGEPVNTEKFYDACSALVEAPNYGFPNQIWMSYQTVGDLGTVGGSHLRYNFTQAGPGTQVLGMRPNGLHGPHGDLDFKMNIFLGPKGAPVATAGGTDAPATPTLTSVTPGALGGGETSVFKTADAGNYYYKVVAFNATGRSAPVASTVTAVAAGQKVVITIAAPSTAALYYVIYRTEVGGSKFYEIDRIPQTLSGTSPAATVWTDFNNYRPNTRYAIITQRDANTYVWKQLMDFARIQLARTKLKIPYVFVLFGMPLWRVPKRIYIVKNIGIAS